LTAFGRRAMLQKGREEKCRTTKIFFIESAAEANHSSRRASAADSAFSLERRGLMRELTFTVYQHVKDTAGAAHCAPWANWVEIFSEHVVRGELADGENIEALERQKNGPAVVLGLVEGTRGKENVKYIDALALDLEKKSEEELNTILEIINPYEWALYSTHKSGALVVEQKTRLRVVLPLAEPLEPGDFTAAWDGLQELVGGANDKSTRDLARLHFLPSTFDAALAIAYHNKGRWLKKEDLLEKPREAFTYPLGILQARLLDRRYDFKKDDERLDFLKRLLDGEALAPAGERHAAILKITYWMAWRFPLLTAGDVEALFARSLEAMQAQRGAGPITQDEIWIAYQGAIEKRAAEKKQKKQKPPDTVFLPEPENPYTVEELENIAEKQSCGLAELEHRWVIQRAGSVYVLNREGDYEGPFEGRYDAPIALRRILRDAPVKLWTLTAAGTGIKKKTTAEIIEEYGSIAKKIVADMSAQITTYNEITHILREAVTPIRRDLRPVEHLEIDGWLKLFGGENYEKLVDWLACCSDLTKPLCALYFDGKKESGKTLFALGCARLWTTGGPADVDQVLGNFNDELSRCPIVFADESLPTTYNGKSVSARLRALLGIKERTLRRKYMSNADLSGALRLILAANNANLLDDLEANSADDLEAIAQRFLYLKVPDAAIEYLAQYEHGEPEQWVSRGIAEHALWLRDNHEIKNPGHRFWVEGEISATHELLLTGGHWSSLVCEWLIRYLINPTPVQSNPEMRGLIKIEGGELLVNEQVLTDQWRTYLMDTRQDPVMRQIGQALRAISEPERKQLRWARRRIRYRVVVPAHLVAWSDRQGIGDAQLIRDRIAGVLAIDADVTPTQAELRAERKENVPY